MAVAATGCSFDAFDTSDGGLAALAGYRVTARLHDGYDYFHPSDRNLSFRLSKPGGAPTHPECASIAGATVRFAGQPVTIDSVGGWHAGSAGTLYGDPITWDECYSIRFFVPFFEPIDDRQNGTLEIDGDGLHFAVSFAKPVGSPQLDVVSVSHDKVVLRPVNFPGPPLTRTNFFVTMDGHGDHFAPPVDTFQFENGQLTARLITGGIYEQGPTNGTLNVIVHLGPGQLDACVGFDSCESDDTIWIRSYDLVIPGP